MASHGRGTLSIVGGCIALAVDGPWLVWPVDYGLSANEPLEVWDGKQRRVAEIGDRVKRGRVVIDERRLPRPWAVCHDVPVMQRSFGYAFTYAGIRPA